MANNAQIDETQLKSILAEVEAELGKLAKSSLEKARPGEDTKGEDEPDTSTTDPTGDNTSAASVSPDAASASPDGAGSDDASASPPPDASASPPGGETTPPGGSGAPDDASASPDADPAGDQGPIDPQALMAEYSKLSPEDQKLHYMCLKQVLMQTLAGAGADDGSGAPPPAGPDASAPPPAAAAPGAPPPAASAPAPALKAEIGMKEDVKANGENPLSKSEFDKAVNAKVEAAISPVIQAVKHVLEAPLRKSVKSIADLPVVAPEVDVTKMSREQMRVKLNDKLQAGTLSKSEKDLMIGFDTGKVKADQIAHLLK